MAGIPFDLLHALNNSKVTFHEHKTAVALMRLIYGPGETSRRLTLTQIAGYAGLTTGHVHTAIHGRPASQTSNARPGLIAKAILLPANQGRHALWRFNPTVTDWPLNPSFMQTASRFATLAAIIDPLAHLIQSEPRLVFDRLMPVAGREDIWLQALVLDAGSKDTPNKWLTTALMKSRWSPSDFNLQKAKEILGYAQRRAQL